MSGAPLASRGGAPVLFSAWGAYFHLEHLEPDDEGRLDEVNDLIWDWFGAELNLTTMSCAMEPMAARRKHLDYISSYAGRLDAPTQATPDQQFLINNLTKFGRNDFEVTLHGDGDERRASPFGYAFWSEIAPVSAEKTRLSARACLRFTVPDDGDADDFAARVTAIASRLRFRWGAAGFTYSMQRLHGADVPCAAIYAHARRFVGYDAGFHIRNMDKLHGHLRSVNWLTFLGEELLRRVTGDADPLTGRDQVSVSPAGPGVALRAGPAPRRGDINRLDVPQPYRVADEMVRMVRAPADSELLFLGPWSASDAGQWLERFELHTSS